MEWVWGFSNLASPGEPPPPASHDHFNHCFDLYQSLKLPVRRQQLWSELFAKIDLHLLGSSDHWPWFKVSQSLIDWSRITSKRSI